MFTKQTLKRTVFATSMAGMVAVLITLLNACTPERSALDEVREHGELHVLTRNAATTYYEGPQGPSGLEYDLVRRFADHLGVRLKVSTPNSLNDILQQVSEGKAHFAAAGLTVTDKRRKFVRFAPAYQEITPQLIYRRGKNRPKSLADTSNGLLEVMANSSHVERLKQLQHQFPDLEWHENSEAGSTELLTLVAEDVIDYTIADSNELILIRRYHPELGVAFDLTKPQQLAWAFPKNEDDSLYREAVAFFDELKQSGELARLIKHNYVHARNYDYAGTATFLSQIRRRLPRYQLLFEEAAAKHNLDWRLLAVVAYQESHWNPKAVSPTGVRGIMMLTQATAAHLGVSKRTDPVQSIDGGARYLRKLLDKIPAQIPEPDRTWLALASYNVGFGHVQDARKITRQRGGNPDMWTDVKENLPLLQKRKWYRKTRYGYARGREPVRYVETIRSYYDIIDWQMEKKAPRYAVDALLSSSPSAI